MNADSPGGHAETGTLCSIERSANALNVIDADRDQGHDSTLEAHVGQRCNLIVIEHGKRELYYSHWGANTLDRDLFWGAAHGLAHIRAQVSEADGATWLDDVWAEGGAVMDMDQLRLTWFGGEDTLFELPLRRRLLELMRQSWGHWDVRWAFRGIVDIAEAAGVPAETVLTVKEEASPLRLMALPTTDRPHALFSVRLPDGKLRFVASTERRPENVGRIERIVEAAGSPMGSDRCDMTGWEYPPMSGAHVEVAARSFTWWSCYESVRGSELILKANPGWSVDWVGDRYEAQVEASEGNLIWSEQPSAAQLDDRVRDILLHEPRHRGVMASQVASLIPNSEVDSVALRDDPLALSREWRRARLAEILR